MEIYKKIKEVLFPQKCLGCSKLLPEKFLFCMDCFKTVDISTHLSKCKICSEPFEYDAEDATCIQCQTDPPYYDQALYLYEYAGLIKNIILKIKFADHTHLAKFAARLYVQQWRPHIENCDYISFVPMHRKRLSQRFFNQSALIAKHIGRLVNRPVSYDLLVRKKHTTPQSRLSKSQRKINIQGVFSVKNSGHCKNKKIILIDDVYTTGATVNECAKALKRNNAEYVTVLTLSKSTSN